MQSTSCVGIAEVLRFRINSDIYDSPQIVDPVVCKSPQLWDIPGDQVLYCTVLYCTELN